MHDSNHLKVLFGIDYEEHNKVRKGRVDLTNASILFKTLLRMQIEDSSLGVCLDSSTQINIIDEKD